MLRSVWSSQSIIHLENVMNILDLIENHAHIRLGQGVLSGASPPRDLYWYRVSKWARRQRIRNSKKDVQVDAIVQLLD